MTISLRLSVIPILFFLLTLLPAQTDTVVLPGTEIAFALVSLPGGSFTMGGEAEATEVELSPFWMATTEVTHDAFRLFQRRDNDNTLAATDNYDADAVTRPSPPYLDLTYGMGERGGYPQVNTTQQAALRYCRWLWEKTGDFYRLPTEAEWEYACLAGESPVATEDNAWTYENAEEKYQPVAQKAPNAWGLYDMLGNVSEWTLDQYKDDYFERIGDQAKDPWMEPERKHSRTVKGGSFDEDAAECDCRSRIRSSPRWQARDPQIPKSIWWNVDSPFLGFRVVRPAEQPTAAEVEAFFAKAIVD